MFRGGEEFLCVCPLLAQNTQPDVRLCPLCCRSLLRLLSHAAQVAGQLLTYTGSYMLQLLGDTEEQPPRRSHSRRGFMCG